MVKVSLLTTMPPAGVTVIFIPLGAAPAAIMLAGTTAAIWVAVGAPVTVALVVSNFTDTGAKLKFWPLSVMVCPPTPLLGRNCAVGGATKEGAGMLISARNVSSLTM